MRNLLLEPRSRLAALAGALLAFGTMAVVVPSAAQATTSSEIVEIPISFTVENVNRTQIDCQANGETYTARGHLWAPSEALTNPDFDTATLYLHGLGLGEFFWTNPDVPGYNFAAQQARDGHVSVVVDRLGYDDSDHPDGAEICFGARATIAHQMVQDLRSGDYTLEGAESRSFDQVVIAGHSVGGLIVEAEAEAFGDVDGVIDLSYSDKVTSQLLQQSAAAFVQKCKSGDTVTSGGAPNYNPFAPTAEAFVDAFFYTQGADPDVVAATTAARNVDPCGDVLSYMAAVQSNIEHAAEVTVPILFAGGEKDALYPQPAAVQAQAELFSNAPTETAVFPDTGHALLQHKTEQQVQQRISQWLDDHGFGPPEPDQAPRLPQFHVVHLAPLNGSDVRGTALLIEQNGQLHVTIFAFGLEPGMPHPQHIHGLDGDTNAVCPSPDAADQIAGLPQEASDPDQFISLEEGQPSYGPVLLPLTPFPDATPVGIATYSETFPVSGDLTDLSDEVVVLHGLTLDGGYAPTVPVACGQID